MKQGNRKPNLFVLMLSNFSASASLIKLNRRLEGKQPDDVICGGQTVRAQNRHGGEWIHKKSSK